jgi:coenzyme F420-dependent glucose-6-phosphate dehydrogenase
MAVSIAYHASHEQFSPSQLLSYVKLAEESGFDAIHSSDHFHPWGKNQGQSGFTFSWIGAAMQATTLPFSMVCAPGQRYHPAIVAQAIATIAEMFPKRFHVELGSGEALNEMITGEPWPDKETRNKRLLECVDIIRRLLKGEEVNHDGLVKVKEATLYTRPAEPPLLYCAALSTPTSAWAGEWADGLLTTDGTESQLKEKYEAFCQHGGVGKPLHIQYSFSYAKKRSDAIDGAFDQWRFVMADMGMLENFSKPEHFDKASANVTKKDIENRTHIVTTIEEIFEHISLLEKCHADRVILHNINKNHEEFLHAFASYKKS